MTDHQHAADSVPDEGTPSDARPAAAAGEEPRAHEQAGGRGRAGAREEPSVGAPTEPTATGARPGPTRQPDPTDQPGPTDATGATEKGSAADEESVANKGSVTGEKVAADATATLGMTDTAQATESADAPDAPTAPGPGPGSGPGLGPDAGPSPHPTGAAAPPSDAMSTAEPPHKFRRDRRHKMLAGVCAGLGRQCDMDPVIFRITLAVLSATGGIGLIFYGFAWLFVPYADEDENEVRKLLTGRVDGQALTAVLFALVGSGVFLTMMTNGGVLTFAVILSFLLAGAGYWSQRRGAPDPDPLAAQAVADAPPEAQAPPVPAAYPSWWRDPIVKDGTHVGGTGYLWGPRESRDRDIAAAVTIGLGTSWTSREEIRARRTEPPKPRGPRWIGGWVFLLALLAGGLGTGLTWEDHALGTTLQAGLACALVVFGLGIAVSSFLGRTGAGSIFLAIITAALLAASAALPKDISTHWMEKDWRPATATDVLQHYDVGTGAGTLDLTRLKIPKGQTVTTRADVGVGRLKVIVPKDVTANVRIDIGVGDIQLPGEDKQDVDVAPDKHKELTLSPTTGSKNAGTLDIDLNVGIGQAEVSRAAS